MTKKNFMGAIQQTACLSKRYRAAWDAATEIKDTDRRWKEVEDIDGGGDLLLNSFSEVFGVTLPAVPQRKPRLSEYDRMASTLAKATDFLNTLTPTDSNYEMQKALVERLKAKLARLEEDGE